MTKWTEEEIVAEMYLMLWILVEDVFHTEAFDVWSTQGEYLVF